MGPEQDGLVVAHYGTQVAVESAPGRSRRCHLRANLEGLVTGDRVVWREGDPMGVVVAQRERHSVLSRPDPYGKLKPVAANIDQILLVITPLPEPHANLIDRYLVACRTNSSRDGTTHRLLIELDQSAFSDWVQDQRSALGLLVAQHVKGDPASCQMFCAWDTVLRSILDGRSVYQSGEIALRAPDGSNLNLDQTFRPNENPLLFAHFLAETGSLILKNVFTEEEPARMDVEFKVAVDNARLGDGESWWPGTKNGERYPCRILNLTSKSPYIRSLLDDPNFLATGQLLGIGHVPGDPFGEHFSEPCGKDW